MSKTRRDKWYKMLYCGGCSSQSGAPVEGGPGDSDTCWLASSTSRHLSQVSSVGQLCPTLWSHGLQHTRLPCPSSPPGACWNWCPLSRWCHPTISSSVIHFSSSLWLRVREATREGGPILLNYRGQAGRHHHSDPSGAQWKLFKAGMGGGHFRHWRQWLFACQVTSVLSYSL